MVNNLTTQNGSESAPTSNNWRFNTILDCVTLLGISQKNYGKTPAELEGMTNAFDFTLPENLTNEQIKQAFRKYAQMREDMPAPANILNIINHGYPEPRDSRYVAPTQTEI